MLGHIRKVLPVLHADVATANLQDFGRAVVGILLLSQQAPHGCPFLASTVHKMGAWSKRAPTVVSEVGMVRKTLWVPLTRIG